MVHFVGAGSGAPDLITVRGAKLLREADVVIYAGSLVNPALLDLTKEGCAIYNSAKMTLEEVIQVIQEAEAKGLTTVRLHTGDPSIYGAIQEQFQALDKLGIAYDVCPGVSAFCAAAAALKVEYTVPEVSQSVIITREAGRTPIPEKESVASFAQHEATMIFYLSTGLADKVQENLIKGGLDPATPVAILYKVSWPEEKIYRTKLAQLSETVKKAGLKNTALLVVGQCLEPPENRSRLYDPTFTTLFRQGKDPEEEE